MDYLASNPQPLSIPSQPAPTQPSAQQIQINQTSNISNDSDEVDPPQKSDVYQSPDDIAIQVFLNTIRSQMQIALHDDNVMESSTSLIEALDISSKEQRIKKRSDQPSYVARTKEEEEFDEKTNEQIKQLTQRLNFSEDQIQSHVEYIMLYSDKSTTMILAHSVVVVFWIIPSDSSSLFCGEIFRI